MAALDARDHAGIKKLYAESEEETYSAPTRVGPMSKAAIAQLMGEAEHPGVVSPKALSLPPQLGQSVSGSARVSDPPRSGTRLTTRNEVDVAKVAFDEGELEPTTLSANGACPPMVTVTSAKPSRVVETVVEEMASSFLEDDGGLPPPVVATKPPPLPSTPPTSSAPAARLSLLPIEGGIVAPLSWRPDAQRNDADRAFFLRLALGAAAFVAVATMLVWGLFSTT